MKKKENLEIEKAPEALTEQDLEKVSGGHNGCVSIGADIDCFTD